MQNNDLSSKTPRPALTVRVVLELLAALDDDYAALLARLENEE